MKRRKNNHSGRRAGVILLLIAVLLTGFSVYAVRTKITPVIKTVALSRANNIATVTINNTVNNILQSGAFQYDDLVRIEYDSDGKISAVKTDNISMNMLKSQVSVQVAEAMEKKATVK